VAEALGGSWVMLAADADDAGEEIEELAMKLEDAMMLPFVLLCDASGQFLGGASGLVEPAQLIEMLREHAPPAR
ncbi:MAG: hypothetical protein AAF368_01945, partial [Planctomycetota bacterium]